MSATSYRASGDRAPVLTASAAIASGVAIVQEGLIGVSCHAIVSGAKGEMHTRGIFYITVPGATAKGDLLYVPGAPATESAAPVLTKTATSNTLFGIALDAIDASNKARVLLVGAIAHASQADVAAAVASQVANPAKGIAAGYAVARGSLTPDAATKDVVTGLDTVVAVVACLDGDPVATHAAVSATIGDQAGSPAAGTVTIKSWKPTSTSNPVLIASSTPWVKVTWIAIGTKA